MQSKGIPRFYSCTNDGQYNVMVMDLLGESLEVLFSKQKKKFNLSTTLQLGIQMIDSIEYVHSKGYLHRDMKPDNFVLGGKGSRHKLYMIDYGLAKQYKTKDRAHIPYKDTKNLTGTARYASLNTHLGIEQGRRDDL